MSKQDTDLTDEQAIPLLDDVVEPDLVGVTAAAETVDERKITDHQVIIEVLREGITAQLNKELQPILSDAIEVAVKQATKYARKLLLDELHGTLENRLRTLIEEAVEQEFGKR